jgi:hypothetical protein
MSSTHLSQKTLQKSAPISSESGDRLRTGALIPEWIHEPEAAELLAIKPSTLRNMRRERRLDAGTHWVYATGSVGGPVVYCIPAIREMQRQRTIEAVQKEDERREAELKRLQQDIEIYDETTLDQQVDGGQG